MKSCDYRPGRAPIAILWRRYNTNDSVSRAMLQENIGEWRDPCGYIPRTNGNGKNAYFEFRNFEISYTNLELTNSESGHQHAAYDSRFKAACQNIVRNRICGPNSSYTLSRLCAVPILKIRNSRFVRSSVVRSGSGLLCTLAHSIHSFYRHPYICVRIRTG